MTYVFLVLMVKPKLSQALAIKDVMETNSCKLPRGRKSINGYNMKPCKSQINEEREDIVETMMNIDD